MSSLRSLGARRADATAQSLILERILVLAGGIHRQRLRIIYRCITCSCRESFVDSRTYVWRCTVTRLLKHVYLVTMTVRSRNSVFWINISAILWCREFSLRTRSLCCSWSSLSQSTDCQWGRFLPSVRKNAVCSWNGWMGECHSLEVSCLKSLVLDLGSHASLRDACDSLCFAFVLF